MSELSAVAYVSSASHSLSEADLERLLEDARRMNSTMDVTGVLLYDDGAFFQYLEGPTEAVKHVYKRILQAKSHRGLLELLNRPVPRRSFSAWQMGFSKTPASLILKLSQATWQQVVAHSQKQTNPEIGMELLVDFWTRVNHSQQGEAE